MARHTIYELKNEGQKRTRLVLRSLMSNQVYQRMHVGEFIGEIAAVKTAAVVIGGSIVL